MKPFLLIFLVLSIVSCSSFKVEGPKPKKATFHPIWIKNHDPEYNSGNLPIGLQSPLIHEGILYIGHNKGEMHAYELSNGRLIWKTQDGGAYHNAPILYGDNIIYGTVEGRVYCRNRLNGKLVYNVDLGAAVESDGVLSRGRLIFHTRNHKIFNLDAQSGKILWAYKRSVPFLTTLQRVSKPLVYGDKIFVGFADGVVGAFSFDEGVLLWERKIVNGPKFIDVDMSPLLVGNKLILGSLSGPLTVLNPINGFVMRRIKLNSSRQPLFVGDNLLIGTSEGELVYLDSSLKIMKKIKISENAISSINFWKDQLAVSTVGGELFHVNKQTLDPISKIFFGHETSAVFGNLMVNDGKLAVYSSRNRLYVFE